MDEQKIQDKIDSIHNISVNLVRIEQAKILEEITVEHVRSENNNNNATDGIFDALGAIAESVQENFEELVRISKDKRPFIRSLTKILTLLLNTNVNTAEKIEKILKIAIETTLKIRQNQSNSETISKYNISSRSKNM